MAEHPVDFRASCQEEKDGSLTVLVHISGLRDMSMATKVATWLRECIRDNAHKIGRRGEPPTQQ